MASLTNTQSVPCFRMATQESSSPLVNVLLTSFAGLGLPRTLSLPVQANTSIGDVVESIYDRLPSVNHRLIITTTSNKQLLSSDNAPVSSLVPGRDNAFLPLRLSSCLCGGKGGFGSQLRAAGGRMSSRKNRNQNQNPNGSNRNLDGRRLRVIDAAKDLARHLATQPGMSAREKEEKRKRWESVVDAADKRSEEIRSGMAGREKGRLDAEYVESKDLAEEKTREAVLRSMKESVDTGRTGSESSMDEDVDRSEEDDAEKSSGSSDDADEDVVEAGPSFFGWDDEDEDDDSEDDDKEETTQQLSASSKGKARAV